MVAGPIFSICSSDGPALATTVAGIASWVAVAVRGAGSARNVAGKRLGLFPGATGGVPGGGNAGPRPSSGSFGNAVCTGAGCFVGAGGENCFGATAGDAWRSNDEAITRSPGGGAIACAETRAG